MIKIDLITGFLGSGKTTFIKQYAAYLVKEGNRIGILENDYGAVNVDMMLLQEVMGERCELEMVAGGCDAGCHKRRFKTKLITMAMFGYDRVLVEPSGIYDVDEFFDTLREEPLDSWYEIGNVIAIVDAKLEDGLSKMSDYMLASQIANAGKILLSKSQEATDWEITRTIEHLNRVMEQVQCRRRFQREVFCKDWRELTQQDWDAIAACGYTLEKYVKLPLEQNNPFSSLYYVQVHMTEPELRATVEKLMGDRACGSIFRIKGFMRLEDGRWLELNATHQKICMEPIEQGQEIIIVIGENLVEEVIDSYWKQP